MTSRIRLLYKSATTITPLEGIAATPYGLLKLAAAPKPFAKPLLLLPASVVTTPRGVTSRMQLLFVSATAIASLEEITVTPSG